MAHYGTSMYNELGKVLFYGFFLQGVFMNYTLLNDGKTSISGLSLGTWAYSDVSLWGACDKDAAVDTLREAVDRGINLIDTAERYGDGRAETVVGNAVKGIRDKVILATKVYSDHLTHDALIKACDDSLQRLQTDYIDIYQIHWPNADVDPEETFGTFEELKAQGKIRLVSVCNYGKKCMESIRGKGVVLDQLAYSLVWRLTEYQMSPVLEEENIPVWAYSPLAQGLLTGKFKTLEDVPVERRANRMYDSKWGGIHTDHGFEKEIFEFLDELRVLSEESGLSMPALAFGFLKSRKNVGSILTGCRTIRQLDQNMQAYEAEVPDDVIRKLDDLSLALKAKMGTNADLWQNGANRYGGEGRMF